jgi:hypothetical protein
VDPLVAEIHATRERIMMDSQGDLHTLCEKLRAIQEAAGRSPRRHESRPPDLASGRTA